MSEHTANPLGAAGDVTKAAQAIKERGLLNPPELRTNQPAETPAPDQANQSEPKGTPPKDPATGRFVKTEPKTETEETTPTPDGADVSEAPDDDGKSTEQSAPDDGAEELAEEVDGLAKQLGLEPEQLREHLKARVKINGEEKQVNLRELIAGYQMESDYRQKTAELAKQRQKFDAEAATYQQQREALSSQLQPLVQELERLVVVDDQKLQQLLNDGDILEYERVKYQAEQRRAHLQSAKEKQQQIDGEKQREAQAKLERDVEENEKALFDAKPEWRKDIEKGRKSLSEIRQYLKDEGYPPQEADGLYNAKGLLMAEKAMKWDALQRMKPDQLNRAKSAPKFQKPGAVKPAVDPKKQVHRANLNRLRRTGSWKDAAAAIKSAGLVQR